jgi:hypothetical protein
VSAEHYFNRALVGTPRLLGSIVVSGSSLNNSDTATPFNASGNGLAGKVLLIQPSADVHVLPVTSSAGTVATTTGVKVLTDERVVITMDDGYTHLAVIGTATVKVFELRVP